MPPRPLLLDLDQWFNGTERQRAKLARDVDTHLQVSGTFSVVDHGIEQQVFDGLRDSGRQYFASLATEGVDSERFVFGPVEVHDPSMPTAYPDWYGPITWPTTPDDFQMASELFWREAKSLAHVLLELFALAIGLPQSAIADQCRDTTATGCLHRIRSVDEIDRCGTFTIVDVPAGAGIEAFDTDWTRLPIHEGALVVGIGEMLQRWTNDRWAVARHRTTRTADGDPDAIALVFSHAPDADAVMAPFSTCTSADRPARYEPVLVMDLSVAASNTTPSAG